MTGQEVAKAPSAAIRKTHKSTRRHRVPLSCDPCRTRKLKCNRERPCQNCTVRGELAFCRYEASKSGTASSAKPQGSMQSRIDQLESMVKRLITQQQQQQQTPPDGSAGPASWSSETVCDTSDSAGSPGKTVIDGVHSVYNGADDWYDVLQEINGLKQVWSQAQDDQPEYNVPLTLSNNVDGSSLLFGQVQRIDKIDLLTTLPAKPQVDRLIQEFFDRDNFPIVVVPILHKPTFMREYTEHWEDPSCTNIIWLGLLFSILSITMLAYTQHGEPPEYDGISESLFQLYRLRTAQCLIMGDISKCLPYTIETLRLNATAEFNRKEDTGRGLWIMTGVMVRAAINMGYHRDPSKSPSISPLKAEYRRRVWFSVVEMDDMASFVVGFPRMIQDRHTDTVEPRNVHDWELLDSNLAALPISRPMNQITPVSYLIAKTRLFRVLSRVADFNNTAGSIPYSEVLEIDNALDQAYKNLPKEMRMHSVKLDCTASGKKADLSTLNLRIMHDQGMCQLHRKFIARGRRQEPQFNHSRDRCLSSAISILNYQSTVDLSWYKLTRTRKVLTLAAMILLLELEYRRRNPETDRAYSNHVNSSSLLLQVLSTSCALWEESRGLSEEAAKIHQILASMLSSFQSSSSSTFSSTEKQQEVPLPLLPESLLTFPGLGTSFQYQPSNLDMGFWGEKDDPCPISKDMEIDWATWDAFMEGAVFDNSVN